MAFLRHVGCPFAEATARDLNEVARSHPELGVVAVSHGTAQATGTWCQAIGVEPGVTVLIDEPGELYAAWGLGLTDWRHFLGRRSLSQVTRLAKRGIRNRHPSGSRWQSAGTFGVDGDGVVRWRHIPEHAGDLPAMDDLIRVLKGGT